MKKAIVAHMAVLSGVLTLKWLVVCHNRPADQDHLDEQGAGRHPGHQTYHSSPAFYIAEQPHQRRTVDCDREGELGWFEPRRRPRDAPLIEDESCEGRYEGSEHRADQNSQSTVVPPTTLCQLDEVKHRLVP